MVTIFSNTTATADAGLAVFRQCNNSTFTMSANVPPSSGGGVWTKVSGPGVIVAPTAYNTRINGVSVGSTTVLKWTVNNGACSVPATDEITLINDASVSATAGPDQSSCSTNTFTLNATAPVIGTGNWTLVSGSATITDATLRNTTVTVPIGTSATLRWTVTNGACSASDDVIVTNTVGSTTSITATENSCLSNDDKVVANAPVTLTASGSGTFQWGHTASTVASPTAVNPTATTTYTVTLTDASGCRSVASKTITVIPSVNANITSTENSCITNDDKVISGQPVNLTASGGVTYSWNTSPVSNTAAITVNPTATTTYVVTIVDGNGCRATFTKNIVVVTAPTVTISATENSCTPNDDKIQSGQSVTLSASGATSYTWSTGDIGSPITKSPTSNTTYTVTGFDAATGCSVTANKTITVSSPAALSLTATEASCTPNDDKVLSGQAVVLTATGGVSYAWSTSPLAVLPTVTVNPATTTTYTVTIVDASGCSTTLSKTITVGTLPTITIATTESSCTPNDGKILSGQPVTLTASGATTYVWSTLDNTASITQSPILNTTYTVTGTDATSGCTATATRTITIVSAPTTSITAAETSCTSNDDKVKSGDAVTLTATGTGTFSWSPSGTGSPITFNPSSTTTYTVTLTDVNGCTATASKTITVVSAPTPSIVATESSCTPNDDKILSGQAVSMTASGGVTYAWSNGLGSGAGPKTPSPALTATTTFTVTVTDANGCIANATKTINVISPASTTITAAETSCTTNDDRVVAGTTVILTASGTGTYLWGSGETAASIPKVVNATSTYNVTYTDLNGCTATASKTITVTPAPTANAGADQTLCNTVFSITGNAPVGLQSGLWTVVSGSAIFASATSRTTTVTIPAGTAVTLRWTVSEGNCSASDDVVLNAVAAIAGEDQTFCAQPTFLMTGLTPLAGTGTWSVINGTAIITNPNSATTAVAVPIGTSATFRWTVNTGICGVLTDDVTMTNFQSFNVNAGPDVSQCNNGNFNLSPGAVVNIACAASGAITNGGFEAPYQAPNTYSIINETSVPGWKTTATDHMIEFWGTGFNGVTAREGSQFVELNANLTSALYQDLCVVPGDSVTWSVAHRGRAGVDSMVIKIGMPGALVLQRKVGTGTSAWVVYTGSYKVPAGQTVTRFQFEAVRTATGDNSVGNFIDDVKINLISRIPVPGVWSVVSGTGTITNPTNPSTTVTGVPVGTSVVLQYTANNGVCTVSDTLVLTNNPIPVLTAIPNLTACNGEAKTVTFSSSVTGTTYNWTNSNTAVGLPASGTGNLAFTARNTGTATITSTVTVTPVYNGCPGTARIFTITVYPTPSVIDPADQSLCSNTSTTAVTFSGSPVASTTYSWTNDNTSIGLAASGTGNIAAFTGINNTSVDQVANITVTPIANGCPGTPQTFRITVKPRPSITVANQILCNGIASNVMNFTSPVAGTTFSWTNSNTAIGLAASGTAPIASFTPNNTTALSQVATINVAMTANGCSGTSQSFTITVNPTATALPPSSINSLLVNFGSATCANPNAPQLSIIANPFGAVPPLLADCNFSSFGNFYSKYISYNPKDNKIYLADISSAPNTKVWILDVGIQGNISCPTISPTPAYTYNNFQPNNFEFDADGDLWALTSYNNTTKVATLIRFDEVTGTQLGATVSIQFPTGTNALSGSNISSGDITILPNGRMFATLGDSPSKLYEITNYTSGGPSTAVFLANLPANTYGIAYVNGHLEITGTNLTNSCYYYDYDLATNTLSAQRNFQYGETPIDNTSITPAIGVTKQLVSSTMVNSNTADLTYEVYVKNTGNVLLNNVSVTDNLGTVFGAANVSNVTTSFVSGGNPAGIV